MFNIVNFSLDIDGEPFFTDLSFTLEKGKLHFLRGKNGSGKSTLFRALDRELPSNYVDQDVQKMMSGLFTFEENLQFAAFGRKPSLWKKPIATVYIPSFEIGIDRNAKVELLSGGQKQILSLLMALQKPTEILLLDEPTAALDFANSHMVMAFLQGLTEKEGLTLFVICHDDDLIEKYVTGSVFTLEDRELFEAPHRCPSAQREKEDVL
ncbi:MAG: ATP-binding cassette domain-containing protein [Verrucomicrobia bacterium]|nr:ATP-binding cassette domain-containing protein [Verrucomicrobiota bacterium]